MAIDGVNGKIIRQPDGKYTVQTEFGPQTDLNENDARKVAAAEGMSNEEISLFFSPEADEPAAPAADGGKPNSVFANTGIANGGAMKTRKEYRQDRRDLTEKLYTDVHDKGGIEGYKHNHSRIHARKYERAQKAADRVMSSVYFTPEQEAEYKKQKKDLEAAGKRPVLLSAKDMELLHSPEFILTDMDGNAIDLDGNLIGADKVAEKNAIKDEISQKQNKLTQMFNYSKLVEQANKMSEADFKELQEKVNALSEQDKQKPENTLAVALVDARGKEAIDVIALSEEADKMSEADFKKLQEKVNAMSEQDKQKPENAHDINLLSIKSIKTDIAKLQDDLKVKEQEYNEYVKNSAITAFKKDEKGKEVLDEKMVKLISATRIGTDNRLEMEERYAETEALTDKVENASWWDKHFGKHWHMRKAKRLYEHLGYSIQRDNTELIQAAVICLEEELGRNAAKKWGTKTTETSGKTDPKELGSFTYTTPGPWVEEQVIPHTEEIPRPGGVDVVTWYDTIPGHYADDIEHTCSIWAGGGEWHGTGVETVISELGGSAIGIGAGLGTAALIDDSKKKNDIILHDMSPEAFVSAAWDDTDGTAYKKNIDLPRNRAMMEYVVNKAKATGMTQADLVAEILRAQGTNDCLTEDEMLKLAADMRKRERPKVDVASLPSLEIEPGDLAKVEMERETNQETVKTSNVAYKVKPGERPLDIVMAKYHITDRKEGMLALREVRRRMGIPESGMKDGKTVVPEIEVDGKPWQDAYWLPPTLLDGKYTYDKDADVPTRDYTNDGTGNAVGMHGSNEETTITTTKSSYSYIVKDPQTGKEIYRGPNEADANNAVLEYNRTHLIKATFIKEKKTD